MKRTIKSFVLRTGRMSNRQEQALQNQLPDYQLPLESWQLERLFERAAPTVVEIGFGMGHSLVEMAANHPELNYIGIEVHVAGIGSLVAAAHEQGLKNLKVAPYDAVSVFEQAIPDNALHGIQIFFPDPWPKKKHHKRRLIQSEFTSRLIQKLKPGAYLHVATDWAPYAEHVMEVLSAQALLVNEAGEGCYSPRPQTRPLTKFEKRGEKLGHDVFDLIFRKTT